jgi:hypothetical protein
MFETPGGQRAGMLPAAVPVSRLEENLYALYHPPDLPHFLGNESQI